MVKRVRIREDTEEDVEFEVNRKIKNVQKCTYNGVLFRSGLEKFCAETLDNANIPFEYEATTFTLMDKFTSNCPFYGDIKYKDRKTKEFVQYFGIVNPNVRAMTYTPDFVGDGWIIETKGMMTDSATLKQKLFKQHLLDNDLHYIVFVPRNRTQVLETVKIVRDLGAKNQVKKQSR